MSEMRERLIAKLKEFGPLPGVIIGGQSVEASAIDAILAELEKPDDAMFEAYTSAADDIDGPGAMHLQEPAFTAMIRSIREKAPTA